jgi:pectin methylesterase-like acyl-CoA thioesterase
LLDDDVMLRQGLLVALIMLFSSCGSGAATGEASGGASGSGPGHGGSAGSGGSAATDGAAPALGTYDVEFTGPFPSWKNVKDFGARGDGTTDDTAALQRALDDARNVSTNPYAVLYVPAGTYRVTKTLATARAQHNDYLGTSIVGEDPSTTVLVYDGPAGQDMVHLDMWYGTVSRLTFDGKGKANVGLYRGDSFSTYCELSDLWFRDVAVGIQLGSDASQGQAEQAVLRCRFDRCSDAGIVTRNWNTLDIWVWYSRFADCRYGLHNFMGNFHVYQSVFERSSEADIATDNLMEFSFVNNVSVGSKRFFDLQSYMTWGAQVLVQGNRIYDFTGDRAITTGSAGPFILVDNVVKNRDGYDGAPVFLTANDQLLAGNTFTVANPTKVDTGSWRGPLRVREIGTQVVARTLVPAPDTSIPDPPPNVHRTVIEVAPATGDDATEIQRAIDVAAAQAPGTRPVVHIPKGDYHPNRTIVVPALKDLQLVGDGTENGTKLNGAAIAAGGPVLDLRGPSRTVVRDLEAIGGGAGILVENADQPAGRVYAEQLGASGRTHPPAAADSSVFVNGVEQSDVTLIGTQFGTSARGIVVSGGPTRAGGGLAPGQVSAINGASSALGQLYEVTGGGSLLAEAIWYEGSWETGTSVQLASSGDLTLAVMQLAVTPSDATEPLFRLDGFRGSFTVLLSGLTSTNDKAPAHHVELTGNGGQMRVLVGSDNFWLSGKPAGGFVDHTYVFRDTTSPPASAAMFQSTMNGDGANFASGNGFGDLVNVNNQKASADPDDTTLLAAIDALRKRRIEPPGQREAGVTDLKMFRVLASAGSASHAVEIRR